jgi:hypothetical protein
MAHQVDRFGLGMVAGDGDPAGRAQKEDDGAVSG